MLWFGGSRIVIRMRYLVGLVISPLLFCIGVGVGITVNAVVVVVVGVSAFIFRLSSAVVNSRFRLIANGRVVVVVPKIAIHRRV